MVSSNPSPDSTDDFHDLRRFLVAQASDYSTALSELQRGQKRSHWMWYIFPQYKGLGHSATSVRYAIKSLAEAHAYIEHPILGPRLLECFQTVVGLEGRTAHQIFGSPDDLKLNSCATLFAHVSPTGSIFEKALAKFYDGRPDQLTLRQLTRASNHAV